MKKLIAAILVAFLWASGPSAAKAPSVFGLYVGPFQRVIVSTSNPYATAPRKLTAPESPESPVEARRGFLLDKEVSWYGPNFYGNRTACGLALTKTILGVAHRSLPCGTLVTFQWKGKQVTVPVIDRGPYIEGRIWDLTGGLCIYLDHCFTGPIYYRIERK